MATIAPPALHSMATNLQPGVWAACPSVSQGTTTIQGGSQPDGHLDDHHSAATARLAASHHPSPNTKSLPATAQAFPALGTPFSSLLYHSPPQDGLFICVLSLASSAKLHPAQTLVLTRPSGAHKGSRVGPPPRETQQTANCR